ncbi:tRNA threonylcarbamoyladenosine dehydratase [Hypsizygus marmoreus]|uniref:tRNA threonylcarbamoyladenosine dehydratase n=1 Tax=Hypsizygus marmoreus TaxID=39966 RepID=A0A369JCE5_HYPMA|nr:tRNA threonylcarbamoyladenosine dehydratase [Hypsizygus marmoreus]
MNLNFHSHKTQLIATAIGASVATAGLLSAYTSYSRREKRKHLTEHIKRSIASHSSSTDITTRHELTPPPPPNGFRDDFAVYDEDLVKEQLARNYAFFGEESMAKIREGTVVIVGCGGVGSWAAVMLVRSGVSKIRLVDFDYVTLSSLNRHATAGLTDVGTPKVKCIERTLKQIARWVEVDSRIEIWRKEEGGDLLEGADWVIDAIDNIQTKVDLLKYCHDHDIKVFSSMGSGAKCDPTRIQISDISATVYDPLARSVRRRLRLLGVSSGIPVVYSTEVPGDVRLLPLPEEEFEKGPVKELGVFDDFRVRILPVLGPLPSIFGLNAATYILCELAGKPILNPLPIKNRKKLYERLLRDLLHRETKLTGETINKLPIDEDDVSLIFEDVYRGRSVIPPHNVPSRPTLVRWDVRQPLTINNCVVMEFGEAEKHSKESGTVTEPLTSPEIIWGSAVQKVVEHRADELRREREWVIKMQQDFIVTRLEDWARSDKYHNSFLIEKDSVLDAALANSNANGLPEIAVSTAQGKFLKLLASSIAAKRILEVGTLGGYSTIWLARALPDDGQLITLELSEKHAQVARDNLANAGLSTKVEVIVGKAVDSLAKLHPDPPFDLVFIDADKPSNLQYFTEAKRLVRKGGVIIVDNVVRYGRVADPSYIDDNIEGVRNLLKAIQGDAEVDATTIGTVGEKGYDGFLYAIRK